MNCISPTPCDSLGLQQCDYCAWYQLGACLPHYPVPAIRHHYEYNVSKRNGTVMLHYWTSSIKDASKWLDYYNREYASGSPYPNGKGFYPDFGFHMVWRLK